MQPPDQTLLASGNDDTHCVRCGYNLFGLPSNGRCPECALDVWRSTRPLSLRYAAPHWFSRVLLGFQLLRAGLLLFTTTGVATVVAAVAARANADAPQDMHRTPFLLGSVISLAIVLPGLVLATRRDPATMTRTGGRARITVRLSGLAFVATLFVLWASPLPDGLPWVLTLASPLWPIILTGSLALLALAFANVHSQLLRRAGRKTLSAVAILGIGGAVTLLAGFVVLSKDAIASGPLARFSLVLGRWALLTLAYGLLLFSPVFLVSIWRSCSVLVRVRDEQRPINN